MGKKRRKHVNRNYAKLSWNVHNKKEATETSEEITERKMKKAVDDNSVMLERMKEMSKSVEQCLKTFEPSTEVEPEPIMTFQPVIDTAAETVVDLKAEPPPVVAVSTTKKGMSLKKKTKRNLLKMANELGIKVNITDTKAKIIKAIQANQ